MDVLELAEANTKDVDFECFADVHAAKGFLAGKLASLPPQKKQLEMIHSHFKDSVDNAGKILDPSRRQNTTLSTYRLYFQSLFYLSKEDAGEVLDRLTEFHQSLDTDTSQIADDIANTFVHMLRELRSPISEADATEKKFVDLISDAKIREIVGRLLSEARSVPEKKQNLQKNVFSDKLDSKTK